MRKATDLIICTKLLETQEGVSALSFHVETKARPPGVEEPGGREHREQCWAKGRTAHPRRQAREAEGSPTGNVEGKKLYQRLKGAREAPSRLKSPGLPRVDTWAQF